MTRVVDVSNSASFEDVAVMKFFEASTRNLLAQEAAAGVRHHVALSVVGTERLSESGYFRAKITQGETDQRIFNPILHRPRDAVFRIPESACRHFLRRQEGAFGMRCPKRVACENHDSPLLNLLEKTDPLGKITLSINNHLVPSCRFLLNPFAVPQPSNVSEIRGNQIEFVFHLPGPRHPALINQRESDAVLPQHVDEFRNQPILVANLHGKLVFLRKLFQKRN